ncbi:MAG: hypothetical protein EOM54_04565 [Clostridia bacterium]|nr:hypothetical protein [Clostridia bacterium]
MKKLFPLLLIPALLLAGCGVIAEKPEPTPTPEPVPQFVFTEETFPVIEGSAALEPLAEAIASVMLGQSRESASEFLDMGNTVQSYTDLMSGDCGLVLAPEVKAALSGRQPDSVCEFAAIAQDALVFYVSNTNPVDSLTVDQITGIYTGEYTNWSEVGGDNVAIRAFTREDWSGSQNAMENLVMDGRNFGVSIPEPSESVFDGSDGAIGYSLFHYASNMQMIDGYKIIKVEGVEPSAEATASGDYPLIAEYCAVISASAADGSPERILWEWLQGPDGQEFIAAQGYVPVQ